MRMEIDLPKFEKIRQEAEVAYKLIVKVKCPYFNDFVHFNSEGFEHLLFKKWNVTRPREDQYMRLRLLPLAVKVLTLSHTMQEYKEAQVFVRRKSNSVWKQAMKPVKYYAFSAIINNALIKVIVRQVDNGQRNFYSLIPKWRFEEKNGNKKRITHSGNPEED
ncbi:MAG: hypothetical protein P4L74_06950 [Candidatus Doudnabacteria bacterium]|nr:hypothetical protein [Candidatus Doudnabacteria bacterium]